MPLMLIMVSAGSDKKSIVADGINQSVLFGYTPGPESGQIVLQWFGLTFAFKRRSHGIFD